MKKIIPFILAVAFMTGCTAPAPGENTYRNVSADEAADIMKEEKDFVILDVRTPEEYADGHIKGAINIPNEDIADKEPEKLPHKDQLIMVYCRSGNRSKRASEKLAAMGYTNIVEFGGITAWQGETEK